VPPNVLIRRTYRWLHHKVYKRLIRRTYRRLRRLIRRTYRRLHNTIAGKTILTYPDEPRPYSVLYKICRLLGYRTTRNPDKNVDLIINWEDTTFRRDYAILNELDKKQRVVNLECKDISKERVDQVHQAVFGYSLAVDPLTYTGLCVKKSNNNATHDGVILKCPVTEIDENSVYQIVVNNRANDDYVEDIRVPIFGTNRIPFCYKKYRHVQDRFSNENTLSELCEVDAVLSLEENELLLRFCRCMGLDYGELDVLRDADTRKLYVVDVSNTPSGPPNHLDDESERKALERLSKEFVSSFMAPGYFSRKKWGVAAYLFSFFRSRPGN
jgi:hypothetical protein